MFGVGFSEIVIIAVVALLVLGPDRLPEIARTLGKVQRAWRELRDEFTVKMHHISDTETRPPPPRPRPVSDVPSPPPAAESEPPREVATARGATDDGDTRGEGS